MSELWIGVISVTALILSVLAFLSAVMCIAYVVGLRNSTHNISYVPLGGRKTDGEKDEQLSELDEVLEEEDNF